MESYDLVEFGKPLQHSLRPTPQPVGRELLVRMSYCGICHSDVHLRDGYFKLGSSKVVNIGERGMKLPLTMGHEPLGKVVASGPEAAAVEKHVDRLIYPWIGCGECPRCKSEMDHLCSKPRCLGVHVAGGYADYLLVPDSKYLIDFDGIDPAFASTLACSGLTAFSAIRKLGSLSPQDWILVMGAGGLGLMALALLRALGFENLVVADIDSGKWDVAREMGAKICIDPNSEQAKTQLLELDGGLSGAIDFVGADGTASLALSAFVNRGGSYICVGLYGGEINFPLVGLIQRSLRIEGSYVGSLAELRELVDLARSGKLSPPPVTLCSLDEVDTVLDKLKLGQAIGRTVVKFE